MAARHQVRLVVLGADFSTRTPAIAYGAVPSAVDAPLFLSLGDLMMLTSTLEPDDAAVYLMARYLHRRDELAARTDEEVFLGAFVDDGYSPDLGSNLLKRMMSFDVHQRYGQLQPFLAWRNIFAAYGVERPDRLRAPIDPLLSDLRDALRAAQSYDHHVELLLRIFWADIRDDVQRAVQQADAAHGMLVLARTELAGSGVVLQIGLALGALDAAEAYFAHA